MDRDAEESRDDADESPDGAPEGPAGVDVVGTADGAPDVAAVRDRVVDELVRFVRALRRAGADVPANGALDAARALVELGFDDRERVRAGLAAALLVRERDRSTFDRLFAEFWRRLRSELEEAAWTDDDGETDVPYEELQPSGSPAPLGAEPADAERSDDGADDAFGGEPTAVETAVSPRGVDEGSEDDDRVTTAAYSPVGRARAVDVGPAMGEGDGSLAAAVDRLLGVLGGRRSRRWDRTTPGAVDARRALRRSFATGGTVLELPERARRRAAVRTVFLVDVSQSVLDAVDRRFLVRFLRAAFARSRDARVFFFDSSLREVSAGFDAPTVADALAALERAETTWGGGTRIGHALETVRTEHPGAVDRTATVFVVSDGLERGEVDALEAEMARLSKRADAVLWLNPLAVSPEYEPAARGMAAALPYVDALFAFAGPADVEEMARQLSLHWPGDGVGYEYAPRREGSAAE